MPLGHQGGRLSKDPVDREGSVGHDAGWQTLALIDFLTLGGVTLWIYNRRYPLDLSITLL